MGYSEQPFRQRLATMGDESEGVFSEVRPLGAFQRLGWRRPDVSMRAMGPTLRHLPDFYCESGHLVEVMGCGRDGIVKLKTVKYDALKRWHQDQPVALFVWNSSRRQWALAQWDAVKRHVAKARKRGVQAFENDGNEYYPISWGELASDPAVFVGAHS